METAIVQSVNKSHLEMLLNVIIDQAAEAEVDYMHGSVKSAREKNQTILRIVSQALNAWDMQEHTEEDGPEFDSFIKEAYLNVGNFEDIQWEG